MSRLCHKDEKQVDDLSTMVEESPHIAVVIPVYNEENHIKDCLESLLHQTISSDTYTIIVVDGGSTDSTISLVEQIIDSNQPLRPTVSLIDNPHRAVPHARNIALQQLPKSVEFVVEHIGHSMVESNFLELRMKAWQKSKAIFGDRLAGVGVQVIPSSRLQHSQSIWIEAAMRSRLGHSNGQFAQFSSIESTNTPAFVMHSRSILDDIGGWDEAFLTSQDSELSMRLINAGYVLARCPYPQIEMKKRDTLRHWWLMSHRYGFWRTKVLMKYPRRAKIVEFLPWIGLLLTSFLFLTHTPMWYFPVLCYGVVMMTESIHQSIYFRSISSVFGCILALLILHIGFSIGLVDGLFRKGKFSKDR